MEPLYALPEERLAQWSGRLCVSEDAIFFLKAFLPAHFCYVARRFFKYWEA